MWGKISLNFRKSTIETESVSLVDYYWGLCLSISKKTNPQLRTFQSRKKSHDWHNLKACKSTPPFKMKGGRKDSNTVPLFRGDENLNIPRRVLDFMFLFFEILRIVQNSRPPRPKGHSPLLRGRRKKFKIISPLLTKEGI